MDSKLNNQTNFYKLARLIQKSFAAKIKHQQLKQSYPLLHRESQISILTEYIGNPEPSKESPQILYIYGLPGTGKTMAVKHALSTVSCQVTWLVGFTQQLESPKNMEKFDNLFVIDEFDNLDLKLQKAWFQSVAKGFPQKLIVICNLQRPAENILRCSKCKPVLVPFLPYEFQELYNIAEERLNLFETDYCGGKSIIPKDVIQYLCKKFHQSNADLRKMFSLLAYALKQKAESNTNKLSVSLKDMHQAYLHYEQEREPLIKFISELIPGQSSIIKYILKKNEEELETGNPHDKGRKRKKQTNSIPKEWCTLEAIFDLCAVLKVQKHHARQWIKEWEEMDMLKLQRYSKMDGIAECWRIKLLANPRDIYVGLQ